MNNIDDYKDFKKYLLLQLKSKNINDIIFIVEVHSINIEENIFILSQLFHYRDELKKDKNIVNREIRELSRDFNVLFTSNKLEDCINNIELLKSIEKYNI